MNNFNRRLDLLVAQKLFTFVEDPDALYDNEEILFWVHPKSGVLIGYPYTFELLNGKYSHQWFNFTPSEDMKYAGFLLDHLDRLGLYVSITNQMTMRKKDENLWRIRIGASRFYAEKTLQLAICKAILESSLTVD